MRPLFVNVNLAEARKEFWNEGEQRWELERFRLGRDAWILQTHVRLAESGYQTDIGSQYELGRVCISHFDDVTHASNRNLVYNVVARADRPPCVFADWEIVTNPGLIQKSNQIYLPHWVQPGLIPRDASRGTQIKNVVFFGHEQELHPEFRDPSFTASLQAEGINFIQPKDWNDFSQVDLILAVRSGGQENAKNKPPSKLINAWVAGMPAILGPEPAFQAIRKSPEDFFEVRSAAEAMEAIRGLVANPEKYAAMVANGHERAKEFTHAEIAKLWIAAFEEKILPAHRQWLQKMEGLGKGVRRLRNHFLKKKHIQIRDAYGDWYAKNVRPKTTSSQA